MPDIASITAVITGIKNATDIANMIRTSEKSLEHAEVKAKLADLIGALADTKMQLANVKDDVLTRDERIKELEKALELQGSREYEDPYYWLKLADGTKAGPFCQKCQDEGSKWIRLQTQGYAKGFWECKACKSTFQDKTYVSAQINLRRPKAPGGEDW